jgi:hypothetical protein
MINYQTGIENNQRVPFQLLADAQSQFEQPYFQGNAQDAFQSLGSQASVDMSRYATQLNKDFATRAQQAQMQAALAGLSQMSAEQQAENSRLQTLMQYANPLLRGLIQ